MKSIQLSIVLISLSLIHAFKTDEKWQDLKQRFRKSFDNETIEQQRFEAFQKIDELIEKNNQNPNSGFIMEHNERSFMTNDELAELFPSIEQDLIPVNKSSTRDVDKSKIFVLGRGRMEFFEYVYSGAKLPESFDWTEKGWNPKVRDQLQCGSCYTFASAACIEAHYWIKDKKTITLSPQDLKDCSRHLGNNGCKGGTAASSFEYASTKGICYEKDYPYVEAEKTCSDSKCQKVKIGGWYLIEKNNDNALMEALVKLGPVAVSIDAGQNFELNFYKSGIYSTLDNKKCIGNVNHAVLLVGYGSEGGKKYWKVLNSWGEGKGEKGYVRISRHCSNNCGISSQAFVPHF